MSISEPMLSKSGHIVIKKIEYMVQSINNVVNLLYFFGIFHFARTLRSSVSKQLFIVIANIDIGKHALSVVASTIYNQFPITIKSENIPIFCKISQNIFD